MSSSPLDRLRALDACAVSDALERTGHPHAVVGLHPVTASRAIVGRAVTVRLGPAEGTQPTRHLCTAAVDASGPGDVIVIANDGRVDCASWGGLLSKAASLRGVEGVVIDGACRDVPEAVELELARVRTGGGRGDRARPRSRACMERAGHRSPERWSHRATW